MSSELLAPLDLAFWHLESTAHPLHLGALAHFGPAPTEGGHEPPDILALLARRAAAVPRLRMRVRDVLLPVGGAAWSADPDFDVLRHVHEITLPGADFPAETARLAAELMERPVARGLPPWEMYLLSGAPDGSFAVLVKLHHALADGMRAVAIGAGIFDEIAAGRRPAGRARPVPPTSWLPGPGRLLGMARDRLGDLGRAVEVGASVVRASRFDVRPTAALAAESSGTRRIATVTLPLDRVHRVRRTTGGTANDVLLAVVAGALRRWFDGRGLPLPEADPRALVPVSRRRPGAPPGPGNSLSGYLLDLPVTEADPGARLAAVKSAMDRNKAAGPFRGPAPSPCSPTSCLRSPTASAPRSPPVPPASSSTSWSPRCRCPAPRSRSAAHRFARSSPWPHSPAARPSRWPCPRTEARCTSASWPTERPSPTSTPWPARSRPSSTSWTRRTCRSPHRRGAVRSRGHPVVRSLGRAVIRACGHPVQVVPGRTSVRSIRYCSTFLSTQGFRP